MVNPRYIFAPHPSKILLKLSFRIPKRHKSVKLKRGGGGHYQIRDINKFPDYVKCRGAIMRGAS